MKMSKCSFLLLTILILPGCQKNVYYENDSDLLNELYHGNIVGIVYQKESQANVIVNQEVPVDSTTIDASDGTFRIENLPIGNYDLAIKAENFRIYTRSNVMVHGGGTTYLGEIDLSTVPDLVAYHYPKDLDEIVYNNRYAQLTISMTFTRPMDRESVEEAFSTDPPSEGIFYWGNYTRAPSWYYFSDAYLGGSGFDPGATITTYSKITSFTYRVSQKDSYVDTTYNITLATTAHDTAGNFLRFPLNYSFRTIQSASTINGIQTFPFHGDLDVDLISEHGIEIVFPRNMNKSSTEAAITITPDVDKIFLWPQLNELNIYTGGPFLADTTFYIEIDSTAEDLDGITMGHPFSFSFLTAPVSVRQTYPRNGELYVDIRPRITIWFNTYMAKSTIESAFTISPAVAGEFDWGTGYSNRDKTAITFIPSSDLALNTHYTITIGEGAVDLFGSNLGETYTFSFVTRPE